MHFIQHLKKTYILAITKKSQTTPPARELNPQTDPVLTYLVSEIGESRDARRLPIAKNDLGGPDGATSLFNQFKNAKTSFPSSNPRCKIVPIDEFVPKDTTKWSVDRLWTREEKVNLGIELEVVTSTKEEFEAFLEEKKTQVVELIDELLEEMKNE